MSTHTSPRLRARKASKAFLVYAKSRWKVKVRNYINKLTKEFEDAQYGRRPDMFQMLDVSDKLLLYGEEGVDLNAKLIDARFGKYAMRDLRKVLRKIEITSKHLIEVLEKYGMPTNDMQPFINPLIHDLSDPQPSTYESMMKTQDRGEK